MPERPPNIQILGVDGTVIANRGATGGANVTLDQLPPYVPAGPRGHRRPPLLLAPRVRSHRHPRAPSFIPRTSAAGTACRADRRSPSNWPETCSSRRATDLCAPRKVQEIILAVWLEMEVLEKRDLALYLNRVYFGAGAYGIEAAAQRYFNKPASNLTVGEAALLAGLMKGPSRYSSVCRTRSRAERRATMSFWTRWSRPTPSRPPSATSRPSRRLSTSLLSPPWPTKGRSLFPHRLDRLRGLVRFLVGDTKDWYFCGRDHHRPVPLSTGRRRAAPCATSLPRNKNQPEAALVALDGWRAAFAPSSAGSTMVRASSTAPPTPAARPVRRSSRSST